MYFSTTSDVQFSSVTQSCPTLCNPMDCSTPGLPVHHQVPEFTQTQVHWVGNVIQPSHSLSSPSPPTFNLSQHQGLFKWVSSSHQVAKVLEFQLQHVPGPNLSIYLFHKDLLCTQCVPAFSDSSVGKDSACNAGDLGWIPGSGKSTREGIGYPLQYSWASLVARLVKNLPAMWDTWVWSLSWEDHLEGALATPFSILAWKICMDRGAWLATVYGLAKSLTQQSD